MDNIYRITEMELGLFELRLKAVIGKPRRQSALYCTECGNDIPELRRTTLPGVQLCVGCQEVTEVRERNFGGRA